MASGTPITPSAHPAPPFQSALFAPSATATGSYWSSVLPVLGGPTPDAINSALKRNWILSWIWAIIVPSVGNMVLPMATAISSSWPFVLRTAVQFRFRLLGGRAKVSIISLLTSCLPAHRCSVLALLVHHPLGLMTNTTLPSRGTSLWMVWFLTGRA
uniref:Transmembrane protein n=1 Tax=Mesocestoides corti TaxID=53468 RepID=A0A5K3G2X5_MESCO